MTLTFIALTVIVGIAGTFAKNPGDVQKAIRVTIALAAYTFGALVINEANEELGQIFAALVLTSILLWYGDSIAKKFKFLAG